MGAGPVAFGHFHPIRTDPVDVFDVRPVDGPALEEMATPEDRLLAAELDQRADELEEIFLLLI